LAVIGITGRCDVREGEVVEVDRLKPVPTNWWRIRVLKLAPAYHTSAVAVGFVMAERVARETEEF
jgi:hypothetical protein